MLKCYFVIATAFIAGPAAANVPLKEFNNIEYRMTDAARQDTEEFQSVLMNFNFNYPFLAQTEFKEGTIFVLHTPNDEEGEYEAKWKNGHSEHLDRFSLVDEKSVEITSDPRPVMATMTYLTDGNTLINKISIGVNWRLRLTWEFSANQLKKTMQFNATKTTRVYKVNKKSAEDAGKAAE